MVACNGVLFFAALPLTIVGYNIQDDFIRPVRIARLPRHILDDNLYTLLMGAYGLSVLLVLVNMSDPFKGMIVLELFQDEKDELFWQWREFAIMSPTSISILHYFEEGYGNCVLVGEYLCFIRQRGKFVQGVAYNLKEGFWQCLPQCANIEYSMVLSFQPKLW
ncbi:hypothetical protein SUGI_0990540 [Cryptomeria japonica]|nr:hypothetical protein SUGI_0990540 [Cryptomeria japonica]